MASMAYRGETVVLVLLLASGLSLLVLGR